MPSLSLGGDTGLQGVWELSSADTKPGQAPGHSGPVGASAYLQLWQWLCRQEAMSAFREQIQEVMCGLRSLEIWMAKFTLNVPNKSFILAVYQFL